MSSSELPRGTEQLASPTMSSSELPRGTERILVLEDQDQVREFAGEMLERLGYDVLVASNGNDALAVCLTMPASIDLLLADVVMPSMSGPEFVERLRQLHQGFEVIYMSGYPIATIANHGPVGPEDVVIQKPFTLEELACEVRRALDKRPA
jgi:CheY-like chemotaxis protein